MNSQKGDSVSTLCQIIFERSVRLDPFAAAHRNISTAVLFVELPPQLPKNKET